MMLAAAADMANARTIQITSRTEIIIIINPTRATPAFII
jgi:hypothetical protein